RGVYVAAGNIAGDINADFKAEIITGTGAGSGPNVRVFSGMGWPVVGFSAYDAGFLGGVTVAAADLDGDGRAEIVTGPGPGGGPHIEVWGATGAAPQPVLKRSLFAFDPTFTGGVFVG